MKINIEETKFVKEIITKDVIFPYYGWWSNKKDDIIKMEFTDSKIKCVMIRNGWGVSPRILSETIPVNNIIGMQTPFVNSDILTFLRDYSDLATEQEYEDFRKQTLEML